MSNTTKTVIPQLDVEELDPFLRNANQILMVAFINARLLERANLDVRTSVVLYDEAKVFEYAMPELPDEGTQRNLLAQTTVRYWSKGV